MNLIIRLYGYFVCVWFATNVLFQDTWWPLVVLDKFAEYFLVLSVPLLLLAFTTRKSRTVLAATCAFLVSVIFYAGLLNPFSLNHDATAEPRLRVTTYNIWNHSTDLEAVVELINTTQSDVIAIQELTDVQQAEFIELISTTYPYFHVNEQVYGGTTGLFSKLELSQIEVLDSGIDRPAVIADVNVDGFVVSVVSAHLNPSYWAYHDRPLLEIPANYHQYIKDQNTQAQMIIDAAKQRTYADAVVLACDCNSQETASTNKLLKTAFKDAYRSVGFQLGEPSEEALKYERKLSHIDYIWHRGLARPAAVYRTRDAAGSDHAPVIADLVIRP